MTSPQAIRAALGHADVVKFAFLDHLGERSYDFLDRCILGHTGAFEKVESLGSTQAFVDLVDTLSKVLRTE